MDHNDHRVDHNDWPIVGMAHNDYDSFEKVPCGQFDDFQQEWIQDSERGLGVGGVGGTIKY